MGAQRTTPKPSAKKSTTLQILFDLDSKNTNINGNIQTNTSIATKQFYPGSEDEDDELLSIISYCNFIFTFTDPSESVSQQNFKRLKLTQLLSIIKSSKEPLKDHYLSALISMVSSNLFRPLTPSSNPCIILVDSPEDEEPLTLPTPSWPHLQIVYNILLRLIINYDPKTLRNCMDHSFILKLLTLFQWEDPRERDSLKNAYHRIYSRFTFYRSFMRKAMTDVFLNYVFEPDNHRHCGIGDLLEIWGSIINGFTVPLKEEHKVLLTRVLIPLHKPKGIQVYHKQLAYCVSQLVQKEPVLGGIVVRGILKCWPLTNCQKEVLLIGELEELVEIMGPEQYMELAGPLCCQIAKCLSSSNSQVAERALYIWNNEEFVKMASEIMVKVFPAMVKSIENNLRWHWNKHIRHLTADVKTLLEEMDPGLYYKCIKEMELKKSMVDQEESKRKLKWERLEMAAADQKLGSKTA